MNGPIRRVAYAVTVLILLLVGQLTYLQVVEADKLANDPRNVRKTLNEYNRARGDILTADGSVVARSLPTAGDFKYLRVYPQDALFAQVSGYQSFVNLVGSTGVEESYDQVLTGRDTTLLSNLGDFFSKKSDTNNVVLSLTQAAQESARDALGDQKGSVVALDVKTGAVLAMYSNPAYNPNLLAVHNSQSVQNAFNLINSQAYGTAALQRAYREIYPPGSTFKVVTTAAALETGAATPDREFPYLSELPLPQSPAPLRNFGGETCGGSLFEGLVESCNTTFGQLGLDLGNALVPAMANCGVGVGQTPPIDLAPPAATSIGPAAGSFDQDKPAIAKAAIGQQDVAVSVLQMALVAAGVANGGVIMQPHVVKEIQNSDGKTIRQIEAKPWKTCLNPEHAGQLRDMMVQVVARGTGTAAQIDGVTVAGKTGTAQNAGAPHAWFIAFAPAEAPRYAVAVIVPNGGGGNDPEVTGGRVAAPIAKQVLERLFATNPQ